MSGAQKQNLCTAQRLHHAAIRVLEQPAVMSENLMAKVSVIPFPFSLALLYRILSL